MVSKSFSFRSGGAGPGSLRKVHRALALRELWHEPGIARVDLADRLGLSSMAVGRIVRELELAGLATEMASQPANNGRGRPPTGLQLQTDGPYVVGAVISAFAQEVHLFNLQGQSVAATTVDSPAVTDGPATIRRFCRVIKQLMRRHQIEPASVIGAGFTVAASIDTNQQTVTGIGYLGWLPFDLAGIARRALNLPITVSNIADSLLRAEAFCGSARESDCTVLIHSATILGSSFFTNGRLVHGAHFQAGRIGHFPMQPTRLVCSCGSADCLNCSASGWAMLTKLNLVDSNRYQHDQIQNYSRLIREIVSQHQEGTRNGLGSKSRQQIDRVAKQTGAALATSLRYLELTLDPDKIVVAGPLASLDSYMDGIIDSIRASGGGSQIGERLVRGKITSAFAAGIIALLDTVLSPDLELDRLTQPARISGKA